MVFTYRCRYAVYGACFRSNRATMSIDAEARARVTISEKRTARRSLVCFYHDPSAIALPPSLHATPSLLVSFLRFSHPARMPLRISEDPAELSSVREAPEKILVFFSSRNEEGRMWCPDCRDVEQLIQDTFKTPDSPPALIVYVGQRSEWKTPSNPFRNDPFHLRAIPTVIRVDDGARLEESEIQPESLATFISA